MSCNLPKSVCSQCIDKGFLLENNTKKTLHRQQIIDIIHHIHTENKSTHTLNSRPLHQAFIEFILAAQGFPSPFHYKRLRCPTLESFLHILHAWLWVVPEQWVHGHHDTRGTEAALGAMGFGNPLLPRGTNTKSNVIPIIRVVAIRLSTEGTDTT